MVTMPLFSTIFIAMFVAKRYLMGSGGYSNLGARGKNFQKLMLSEKKKRSDLGLHIFFPKSKCSLKKKKKGLHSESSSEQTSAANPKLYMLFSRGGPKKKGGLRRLPHSPHPISTTAHGRQLPYFLEDHGKQLHA